MTRRRVAAALLLGAPLVFLGVLGVQAVLAARAEYLPDDPGYLIEATVVPGAGGAGEPLRLVMLGDSTVAGVGSPRLEQSLPVLVAQRVSDILGRPVEVRGLGVSGARTDTVRTEQLPRLTDAGVDAIVIVVGSNDVTHLTSPEAITERTRRTLRAARDAAPGAVVVLGGIPLFGSADALSQPLRWVVDRYADVLRPRQRAAARSVDGVTYVDIATEASPRFAGVPEAMSSDGFHPAPVGYGFWADALARGVVEALG